MAAAVAASLNNVVANTFHHGDIGMKLLDNELVDRQKIRFDAGTKL